MPRYKTRAASSLRSRNYLRQMFRPSNLAVSSCKCKMKAIRRIGMKPASQITFIYFPLRARLSKDLNNIGRSMSLSNDINLRMINANKPYHNIVKMPSTCSVRGTGKQQYLRLTLITYIWRTIRSKWLETNSTTITLQNGSRASYQVVLILWCLALVLLTAVHHRLQVVSRLSTLKHLFQVKFLEALLWKKSDY